jgi:ABC-2 type transport system permease protein
MKWWTVARREVATAFLSPLAYVLLAVFLLLSGFFFVSILFSTQNTDTTPFLEDMAVLLLFLAPLITMRLVAEEKRLGTDELVLTSPVSPAQWILGKYAGALAVWTVFLAFTVIYPLILRHLGPLDGRAAAAGFAGLWLLGATLLALGLLASSVTDSQVVAAMLGFGLALLFWIASWVAGSLSGRLYDFLHYVSLPDQYLDFAKGLVDTTHLVYFLSLIAGSLFLAVRAVDARRWAG